MTIYADGIQGSSAGGNGPIIITRASGVGIFQHQGPTGSQSDPFAGMTRPYGSFAIQTTVTNGIAWGSRSADEQAILTAIGKANWQHFGITFKVARITFPSGREGSYMGPYTVMQYRGEDELTTAAWCKMVSGNAPTNYFFNGLTNSDTSWKFCGTHMGGNYSSGGYGHPHAYGASGDSACVVDVALPAIVDGYFPITSDTAINQAWWMFASHDTAGGYG
jgi:hypothetical protein